MSCHRPVIGDDVPVPGGEVLDAGAKMVALVQKHLLEADLLLVRYRGVASEDFSGSPQVRHRRPEPLGRLAQQPVAEPDRGKLVGVIR